MFRRDFLKSTIVSSLLTQNIGHLFKEKKETNPNIITATVTGGWGGVDNREIQEFERQCSKFGEQIQQIIKHKKFDKQTKISEETKDVITYKRNFSNK